MSCTQINSPCAPDPCGCSGGCPVLLDMSCVFYHKDNDRITELDGLALSNGATLELVVESIDEWIKQLKVTGFDLPCLRVSYVINSMQQFAEAVDTQLCIINDEIAALQANSVVPLVANDSATIDFSTSGTLDHTLTGDVKLSLTAGQRLSVEADGLYVNGQILSVDYDLKTLTISDGNTVSFASLLCGADGFLGNLSADPSATDGQYWYNTSTDQLKIKVNGLTRIISIS